MIDPCTLAVRLPNLAMNDAASYALPGIDVRRTDRVARVAYWSHMLRELSRMGIEPIASCRACGTHTGNACDFCMAAGTTHVSYHGHVLAGSPLCGPCENNWHCPVCGN